MAILELIHMPALKCGSKIWVDGSIRIRCSTVTGRLIRSLSSALAIHDAVMSGQEIAFAPHDAQVEEGLRNFYIDPRLYFRHLSYEYKAGGTVLYYADKRLEPLSLIDKNWIHTSNRLDIRASRHRRKSHR